MAGVALAFNQPLVLADDVLGDGQAESGTVRTAADHGVEDGFLELGRDARAVVDDLHLAHQAVTRVADGELAQGTAAQGDATEAQVVLPGDRLHGVAYHVEHGLDHLLAVEQQVGDARVVVADQGDAALALRFHQAADPLQHLMDVGRRQVRQFVRAEHAVHQVPQPVGFFDDDVGVVLQRLFRQLAG